MPPPVTDPHPLLRVETPSFPDPDPRDEDGRVTPGEALRLYTILSVACWVLVVGAVLLVRSCL